MAVVMGSLLGSAVELGQFLWTRKKPVRPAVSAKVLR